MKLLRTLFMLGLLMLLWSCTIPTVPTTPNPKDLILKSDHIEVLFINKLIEADCVIKEFQVNHYKGKMKVTCADKTVEDDYL